MNRIPTFKEYISSVTITSAGTNYSETPSLVFPAPDRTYDTDQNVTATGTVTLTGGAITAVTITNDGDGYVTAPVPFVVGFPTNFIITSGTSELTANTYENIPTTTNSALGSGLTLDVTIASDGTVSIAVNQAGNNKYRQEDTITIDPIDLGGQSGDFINASITKINNGSGAEFTAAIDKILKGDQYTQPKISTSVPNQIPEVLQEDFPLFKTLIEKYYQFMEQTNATDTTKHGPLKVLQDFLSKLDVDFNDDGSINTDDNFLIEFFRDYAKDLPQTQNAKLSRVIKDINNFYTAKGSPQAIEYLFQILYNENVTVTNSEQFVLRPSSNKFKQDYVVKCFEGAASDRLAIYPDSLAGQQVDIHYAISTGAVTNFLKKTATVERATKIAYTNPQSYELVLDLPTTFTLPGTGRGQTGLEDQLLAYVRGTIATVTGTGTGGTFENPTSTVVDGTYNITGSDYSSFLDEEYANSTTYPEGTYVKANDKIYVAINEGTTASSGTGPSHEHGEELDGTAKFRFVSKNTHKTTGSSGAEFTVVISGNAVDSVTITDAGTGYFKGEFFEVPASVFGGSGTPPVKFKVDTIANGEIGDVLIKDAGTGFFANPDILVRADDADTITTTAVLETRVSDGAISSVLFTSNQRGVGYNNAPILDLNLASTRTYITRAGTDDDRLFDSVALPARALNSGKFKEIKSGSSTTAGGFKVGDTFKISESGDILGVYASDYFAEDYTLTGIDNNGYLKVVAVGDDGYPTKFEVLAVGVGYLSGEFDFDITSATSQTCTITCKTEYSALLAGVFQDAGSFLSDANKVYDNKIYQNFSYEIETERAQTEWNDYVKRAAHPVGFGVFGNLQVKQSVDMSSNFTVETDVYMLFKYPDIEEILVQDAPAKSVGTFPTDSLFPGEGLSNRAGGLSFFNAEKVETDSASLSDEFGPYTAQGTQVANIYATSDGTISGDAYFFQHPDEDDDYVERFAVGDYFAEDYVEFGNPFKNIEKNLTVTDTGEYATDYFAHDDGRYTFSFSEVSAEIFRIDDSTVFETAITVSADTVDWAESVSISFVFFREPDDTFDIADSAPVIEAQPRPSDTMSVADAVSKLDIGRNPSDTPTWADSTTFDVTTAPADTMNMADSTAFDVVFGTIDDTFTVADVPTKELGAVFSDAMTMADSVDKFDIGVGPSDTVGVADSIAEFVVSGAPTDTMDVSDVPALEPSLAEADTMGVAESGNIISQSYTVDLTYFEGDYVADSSFNLT